MKPYARNATVGEIREAIEDVIAGGDGAMLEATAQMPLAKAKEFANRILIEKGAGGKVRVYSEASWLHITPFGPQPGHETAQSSHADERT